jgi:hypothetical protein
MTDSTAKTDAPTLVLVRDLMFVSKIRATAAAQGAQIKTLRDPALLTAEAGSRLLVDLSLPNALEAARAWKARTGGAVTGFIGHTEVETINAAQSAGIDQVLAKGRFTQMLPDLLR